MTYLLRRQRYTILRLILLFGGGCAFWYGQFPYSPKYTLATGLEQHPHGKCGNIIRIEYLANDGKSLRLTNTEFASFMRFQKPIEWDVVNNRRIEEQQLDDNDWQELREMAGDTFDAHERTFWEPFVHRWQEKRCRERQAEGDKNAAGDGEDPPRLFPSGACLSGDGLYLVHGYDVPLEEIPKGMGYDVIIEEVSTGRRIATIPDQQYVSVAPGGRIAVKFAANRQVEQRTEVFTIWDLTTCRPILDEKLAPTVGAGYQFSRDGRFVFLACDRGSYDEPDAVTWWDEKGRRIGTALHASEMELLASERTLATFSNGTFAYSSGPPRPRMVQFWDVESGALLGTWVAKIDESWFINGLSSVSRDERYVAVSANHYHETESFDPRAVLQLRSPVKRQVDGSESEDRIILLDSRTQRMIIDVPGHSSESSSNGRWFATIDNDSVIRIWELPLRKPWRLILLFAAVAMLACEAVYRFMRRLARRAHWRLICQSGGQ
jgi:hypothetical protein